ncbi:hypothetical protein BC629DRAFT_442641 [Irpex lacteus]|nr:hypothetical protein BC629DRAFT_442641 [Irpex lacteus]
MGVLTDPLNWALLLRMGWLTEPWMRTLCFRIRRRRIPSCQWNVRVGERSISNLSLQVYVAFKPSLPSPYLLYVVGQSIIRAGMRKELWYIRGQTLIRGRCLIPENGRSRRWMGHERLGLPSIYSAFEAASYLYQICPIQERGLANDTVISFLGARIKSV